MANFNESDLRDPTPPVPGHKERAAVAARAHQLGRRRRMMQGAGALGMVAAVAVGVAALTAGGTSSGPGHARIEAASSPGATDTTDPVVSTTVPAPATTVPAPAVESTPSPTTNDSGAVEAPAPAPEPTVDTTPAPPTAPSTFIVSGIVSNIPEGATVTVSLTGPGGTFTAVADSAGHYSMSGVPAGTYDGMYEWSDSTGTATQVGKLGGITITGDSTVSFALP